MKENKNQSNRRGYSKRRANNAKKVEVNVPRRDFNSADFPNVITDSKSDNDPSWYTHIYPVASDVGRIPFNIPVGSELGMVSIGTTAKDVATAAYTGMAVAGVMVLNLTTIPGLAKDASAPINVAAQQLYTLVRQANSGKSNYDKTDLMMTVYAMDNAYMLYEYLLRCYRTFGMYNYMNRYMPDVLLASMRMDTEMRNSMADFKAALDMFAYQLGSINIPDQFDFIKRHSWLFTNIYSDSESRKSQLYLYMPTGFHVWKEGVQGKPTYLRYTTFEELFDIPSNGYAITSIEQITGAIDKIMRPLLGSQDVGNMTGDLEKAFGSGGMIKIMPVEDNAALTIAYSKEVLMQIENATSLEGYTILPGFDTTHHPYSPLDVWQNNNDLVSGPFLQCTPKWTLDITPRSAANSGKYLWPYLLTSPLITRRKIMLNMHHDGVSEDDIFVATRLTAGANYFDDTGTGRIGFDALGTEFVASIRVETMSVNSPYPEFQETRIGTDIMNTYIDSENITSAVDVRSYSLNNERNLTRIIAWSQFDWAPLTYQWTVNGPDTYAKTASIRSYDGVLADLDNYTVINADTLQQLHRVAVMSEFAVKDYKTGLTK